MNTGKVRITGKGSVKNQEEKQESKVSLPPLPDQAIEYGKPAGNPLEDVVKEANAQVQTNQADTADAAQLAEAVVSEQSSINESAITDEPTPTVNGNKKEFVPAEQNALTDVENEGGATKAVATDAGPIDNKFIDANEAVREMPSKKQGFNPGSVQNALTDQPVEGGVISAKSTGSMVTDGDAAKEGFQIKELKAEEIKDKFRVYGFTVQYKNENNNLVTKSISDFFDDLDTAFISVNATKYLMPLNDNNKGYKIVDIVSGIPEISYHDQRIYRYLTRMWKKM